MPTVSHFAILRLILAFSVMFTLLEPAAALAEERRPNILLITADDLNWNSLGAFGCPVRETTPHLDRLAESGIRFAKAHVTIALCAPSRGVMMTGRYPHASGATGFGPMPANVATVPEILTDAGYLCGIIDKVGHLNPAAKYRWSATYSDTGNGRNPSRFGKFAAEFISRAREAGRPFFLMANSRDPHRPFAGSRQERQYIDAPRNNDERNWASPKAVALMSLPSRTYTPDEVVVPGFLPDVPDIREEVADYYNSVRRCDDTVGALLKALDDSGMRDQTLVVFLSDNGMPFPFAKFSCYPNGTHTPLIVRWPGSVGPQQTNDEMIAGVDLAPTLLEAAGITPPAEMDGRSFLPLLKGERQSRRDRVFTAFYSTLLREMVPTRAVQTRRYVYIFNRWADGATQCQNEFYKGPALPAMIASARTDPAVAQRVIHFLFRAPEELYDVDRDPDSLHNLADSLEHRETLELLRRDLEEWMRRTNDPVLPDFRAMLAGRLPPMGGPPDPGAGRTSSSH
ncbi:MAG: sulfatase [Opitutaceae bacterium]|nr:sulfatase [Opitutaceae bacterium]